MRNHKGIDVSMYQGDVWWDEVAKHVGFAWVKATQGTTWVDPTWTKARVKALRAARLPFGVYHYADNSGADGAAEAEHFVHTAWAMGWGHVGDLPGALDIEAGAGGHPGVRFVRRFVKRHRELTGHRPIVYTGSFWRDALANPVTLTRCRLWLAAYVSDPKPYTPRAWKRPTIWQHSSTGSVPGVSGNVDVDRFMRPSKAFEAMRLKTDHVKKRRQHR